MSFGTTPLANEKRPTRLAVRALAGIGLSTFFFLIVGLLTQSPSLQPQLRVEWDPFWLKVYAAAMAIAAVSVWRARGRVLLVVAATAAVSLIATPMLSGATGWALPKLALITGAAIGLGQRGLKRLAPNARLGGGQRLLFATVLGYGAISLLMLALALAHCLHPAVVGSVLSVAGLIVLRDALEVFRQFHAEFRSSFAAQWRNGDLRLAALTVSILCICGFGSYIFAVAPATHWDVLHYHLGVPRVYAERGELADLDHTWAVHCVRNGEMLYLLGLLVEGQPIPMLINFLFGMLAAGLVANLATQLSNRRTGMLAGCIFFAIPLVSYVLAQGMIDLMLTAYAVAAACAFFRWKQEGDAQWICLFSVFAGLAVSTKLNGLLVMAPFGTFLLARILILGTDWRARLANSARAVVPGLLILAPWPILTWIRTGNPVFPFLNKVFRSPEWFQDSNNAGSDWGGFGFGTTWYHGLRLPWDVTFHGERFCEFGWYGTAGILLLGLPFGYFVLARRQRRVMLELTAVILICLMVFLKVAQYTRYMLPVLAFSSIVTALNCQAAWMFAARLPRARRLALGLCVTMGFGWVFFTRAVSLAELWYCLPERYPWRLALGRQTPEEYLHSSLQEYEFLRFIDEQMPEKPVAYLGLGLGAAFYSGDAVEYSRWHSMAGRAMINEESPERLVEMLKEKQIRYVGVNQSYLQHNPDGQTLVGKVAVTSATFLKRYCEPVYGRNNIAMYRVHYEGVEGAASEARSLLQNGDLSLASDGALPDWGMAPGVKVLPAASHPDHPEATVLELTHNDLIIQRVLVRPHALYTLSADFWSPLGGQSCMLQLLWVDKTGKQVENEILECPVGGSPQCYELSRTALPEAIAVDIYIRAKYGEHMVRMSRPRLVEHNVVDSPTPAPKLRLAERDK